MTTAESDKTGGGRAEAARAGAPVRVIADDAVELGFDEALSAVRRLRGGPGRRLLKPLLLLCAPLLGALDDRSKRALEEATGDSRVFSTAMATALNVVLDFFLYPIAGYFVGLAAGNPPLTESDRGWIVLGLLVATAETLVRWREGIFHARPAEHIRHGGSAYGAPVGWLLRPLVSQVVRWRRSGVVPVDGFFSPEFESKRERERRYGEVYTVEEHDAGAYVRLELPRRVPPSAARDQLGLGEEMPDYDVRVALEGERLVVRGRVEDDRLRAVCGISPAFPADFAAEIPVTGPFGGFGYRYQDKTLEIVVLKKGARVDGDGSNQRARG
ncbi:MAG: hypothetical protein D6760_03085 [Deltaproteobacteria bacterium]|nr:MAG: hypothetical protein D6760_03085 [Deltaproteobacteria bacterium]